MHSILGVVFRATTFLLMISSMGVGVMAQTAKTTIPVKTLRGITSPTGSIVAIAPDGRVVVASLGEGIVLDLSGPTPVLRAVVPSVPQIIFVDDERPTPGGAGNRVFSLASVPTPSSSLSVYLNGILLTRGEDYTINGSTVTLSEHYAGLDVNAPSGQKDILRVLYRTVAP